MMTEEALLAFPQFSGLPMLGQNAAECLTQPEGLAYSGSVYEATDVSMVRDFFIDVALVPVGAYRDKFGNLRAVFWQLRSTATEEHYTSLFPHGSTR